MPAQISPQEKRNAIVDYLRSCAASSGPAYVKSKRIADEVGLSSREVGANLKKLAEDGAPGVDIEPWSVTRATTWKVEAPSMQQTVQPAD